MFKGGMGDLMQQAQKMQERMQKMQEELGSRNGQRRRRKKNKNQGQIMHIRVEIALAVYERVLVPQESRVHH